jgi:hypothetical protein
MMRQERFRKQPCGMNPAAPGIEKLPVSTGRLEPHRRPAGAAKATPLRPQPEVDAESGAAAPGAGRAGPSVGAGPDGGAEDGAGEGASERPAG